MNFSYMVIKLSTLVSLSVCLPCLSFSDVSLSTTGVSLTVSYFYGNTFKHSSFINPLLPSLVVPNVRNLLPREMFTKILDERIL